MFAKLSLSLLTLSALVSGVVSTPLGYRDNSVARRTEHVSFDNWGGFTSLHGFDNFYGIDNFAHVNFEQVVVQQQQLVCRAVSIEIIQQRLVVLQEMAKKIITEQICEVEVQTVVFQQFHASLGFFSNDLKHVSPHQVGYDANIVGHFNDFYKPDGSFTDHSFGFSGLDVGKNVVTVGGHNWNDATSPASVASAFEAANGAAFSF